MPRSIEHRADFAYPVARIHAALTDEEFVRARLAKIGGRTSELVSLDVTGATSRLVMRQGIDAEHLPSIVKRVTSGGVTIERVETWTRSVDGAFSGTADASVSGVSGSLASRTALMDAGSSSQFALDGEVKVGIPLLGGKLEAVIVEQLSKLLRAEDRFMIKWLDAH